MEVENLKQALDRKDARAEASEHLRTLIGKIVLTPKPGRDELRIDLHGDLAGILQIASQKQARPGTTLDSGPNKIALVAGAGWPSRLTPLSYVGRLRRPRNEPASQVQIGHAIQTKTAPEKGPFFVW